MAGTGTDRARSAGSPDVDAPSSAEARLRLLVEATAHLSDTLDLRAVARGVARTVVPALAHVVHVDLVESLFHPEGGAVADSGVVLRVATVDLSGAATGPDGDEWLGYPAGGAAALALASGVTRGEGGERTDDGDRPGTGAGSLFVPLRARGRVLGLVGLHRDGGHGPAFAAADVALVEEIVARAALALDNVVTRGEGGDGPETGSLFVPLRARGRVLGLVGLHRADGHGPAYGAADIALAEEIVARAAMALDNVRLYDEARTTAVALQRSLLPSQQPRVTGVESASRYLPGRRDLGVGGDWFDVIPLSCGRAAFVIGDVMGRGLRAAAAMGQLRTAVRMLAVLDPMPEDVLRHLDDLAQGTDEVQLATCVYAVFDPVDRSLSFATAGHPPPVLHGPDGVARPLPQPSGAPLGVGGVPFESTTVRVEDGSRLALYTDGLVESRDVDIDDGLRRLSRSIAAGPADLEALCDHVLADLGRDEDHDDDIALLVAGLHGLDDERVATWHLSGGVEEVAAARAWVRRQLADWDVDAVGELAELLVSELVTNALRHASRPTTVTALLLDEIVTLAVSDADTPLPRLRKVSDADEGGRGLQLVAMLAARWGARPTPDGKVVWCDLALPRGKAR